MKKRSEWAKLPIHWIHLGGLTKFVGRVTKKVPLAPFFGIEADREVDDELLRNECIAALRLYLVLCCRAEFKTGLAKVTYNELTVLAKMSRAVISRSIQRLEKEGLIRRQSQALKNGSSIIIEGWNEENYGWGKIPKLKLYDGKRDRMLLLAEFNYSKASFYALKIFIGILAHRDKTPSGIATVSYDTLSSTTGVPRHHVADAITKLYQMDLISFRQGDYTNLDATDRTNRYLVRGLGSYWHTASIAADVVSEEAPSAPAE